MTNVVGITLGPWANCYVLQSGGTVDVWAEGFVPPGLSNVVAVAADAYYMLAVKQDGRVVAMTKPYVGQYTVTDLPFTNVIAVAAGGSQGLVLHDDGTVSAWGDTNLPSGVTNIVAVAASGGTSMALRADGTVVVWSGDYWTRTVPADVRNVVAIDAGSGYGEHCLALRADGTARGWGFYDMFGETGGLNGETGLVAAVTGTYTSVGLKRNGTLVAHGLYASPTGLSNVVAIAASDLDLYGAIGNTAPPTAIPQALQNYSRQDLPITLQGLDTNGLPLRFRIAALPGGKLYQYDAGSKGAEITAVDTPVADPLGRVIYSPVTSGFTNSHDRFGFTVDNWELPAPLPATVDIDGFPAFASTQPASTIRSDAATLNGAATLDAVSSVFWFEWGTNATFGNRTGPLPVSGGGELQRVSFAVTNLSPGNLYHYRLVLSNALGVVVGAEQIFTTGRKISAWGRNTYGQCSLPSGLSNIVAVAGGDNHSLALANDGTVTAWGDNSIGKCNVPPGLSNITGIAGTTMHSLLLAEDGTVTVLGVNPAGAMDWDVPGLRNLVAVSGGNGHSVVLRADGTLFAWSEWDPYSWDGQATVPAGLSNVVAVSAGWSHNLALRDDGIVVAWGANGSGQSSVPLSLHDTVAVAAGGQHSLALKRDRTVVAWGDNSRGQATVPTGLGNVVGVAAGGNMSAALLGDGTLVMWGDGTYGQTNTPQGLSNIAAIASGSGADHSLAIANNLPPMAQSVSVTGLGTNDVLVTLGGSDSNADPLTIRVVSLPGNGNLYQCNAGARGAPIVSPNTLVTDPLGRVIFAPSAIGFGSPFASFDFVLNDGETNSTAASAVINVAPSFACTQAATSIGSNSAVLNGMALPNGFGSVSWLEWGTNGAFTQTTAEVEAGNGGYVSRVSAAINGLEPGGVYQYRLVVSNAAGVFHGAKQRFTTGSKVVAWGSNTNGQSNVPAGKSNVVAVAAGLNHSLALDAAGTLAGWGDNSQGQLNIPASATNLATVAAGTLHSLALRADGTVVAWGYNSAGQGTAPTGLSNVIAVAGGRLHSVALMADGTVAAWGDNSLVQTSLPGGLSNVVAVACGEYHAAALRANGEVVAWGYNGSGQTNVPAGLAGVLAIACGAGHTLALRTNGSIVSWGYGGQGLTNLPTGTGDLEAIAAGGNRSLALRTNQSLLMWGSDTNAPAGLTNIVTVAAGGYHSLALADNVPPLATPQTTYGFGTNDIVVKLSGFDNNGDPLTFRITTLATNGVLYQYDGGTRGAPITAPGQSISDAMGRVIFAWNDGAFTNRSAGFSFAASDGVLDSTAIFVSIIVTPTYAVTLPPTAISASRATLNGMVLANGFPSLAWFEWGTNRTYGQATVPVDAGNGLTVTPVPFAISGLGAGREYYYRLVVSNAMGIAYGYGQQFTTGMKLTGWGINDYRETTAPAGLSNVVSVSTFARHSVALTADGRALAWGLYNSGQTNVPTNLTNVIAVAAGDIHSLALRADGTVKVWGSATYGLTNPPANATNLVAVAGGGGVCLALNSQGMVLAWGNSANRQTNVPANLSNVVAIAGGLAHCVALRADGKVVAWGNNSYGQTNVPSAVSNVVQLAAGWRHNLALRTDGTVAAWGQNNFGSTSVPAGLSNVVAVAAGASHSAALRSDGSIVFWGDTFGLPTSPAGLTNVVVLASGYYQNQAIGNNLRPVVAGRTVSGSANHDLIITFTGSDTNGDALAFHVATLPSAGLLYQYNAGARGPIITAETTVTDAARRVIFAPAVNGSGSPYASFTVVANDGEADSLPAVFTVNVSKPVAPILTAYGLGSDRSFQLLFNGDSNTTYCVWASSNLLAWEYLSQASQITAGQFGFSDQSVTNLPARFYRVGTACSP